MQKCFPTFQCSFCRVAELHVNPPLQIVEELEDRFGDKIDDILSTVRSSLTNAPSTPEAPLTNGGDHPPEQFVYDEAVYGEPEGWEHDANDVVFDDTGEGAGIEGDLDMDDD